MAELGRLIQRTSPDVHSSSTYVPKREFRRVLGENGISLTRKGNKMRIGIVLGAEQISPRGEISELMTLTRTDLEVCAWSFHRTTPLDGVVSMTPEGIGNHAHDQWWVQVAREAVAFRCVLVVNYAGPTAAEYLSAAGVPFIVSVVADLDEFGTAAAWRKCPTVYCERHVVLARKHEGRVLRNGTAVSELSEALTRFRQTMQEAA